MGFKTASLRLAAAATALLLSTLPTFGAEVTGSAAAVTATPSENTSALARQQEPKLPEIAEIRFVGNEHFSRRELKRDMKTAANRPVELAVLKADVDRIVKMYEDDGYLEAKVEASFTPLAGKTKKELLFTILEGSRDKLRGVEIRGNEIYTAAELLPLAQLEKDGYFSKQAVEDSRKRIWEYYGKAGRLTTVVSSEITPWALGAEVSVRYTIVEGPPVILQSIELRWTNAQVTEEWLVRQELERKLSEGAPLTLEPIEDAIGRIRKHRWFKSVNYKVEPGAAPGLAVLAVQIEEGGTSRVSLGGSAATYSGLGAQVTFTESNFDVTQLPHSWQDVTDWNMFRGRGERLTISAAPGQKFTNVGGSFEQPHTFGTDNTLLLNGNYSREQLPEFNLWQFAARIGLEREIADHWTAAAGPTLEGTEMWNLSRHDIPDYNAVTGYTAGYGAWGRLSYSTTPDLVIVNRGFRASLYVEPTYEDWAFVRTTANAHQFIPVHGEGFDAHVLEVSGNAGYLGGKAPVFERFFLGSLGTVRGFDYWGISPQYKGVPVGGYWMFYGTAEYTFPIVHISDEVYFRGAGFVDYGDTEREASELGQVRIGSGVGLRAVLPKYNGLTAGCNFAWPVKSYPHDSTLVFTFFMGMSY